MNDSVKDILRASRPTGPIGGDKYLADIAQDLRRLLEKTQHGFANRVVRCPEAALSELAALLVEFGEDIHADAGLWRSLEASNREFFGTPLPLADGAGAMELLHGFDPRRIQHLIWTLWLDPEVLPSLDLDHSERRKFNRDNHEHRSIGFGMETPTPVRCRRGARSESRSVGGIG